MPAKIKAPTEDELKELELHNTRYWAEQRIIDEVCKNLAIDRHPVDVPETAAPQRSSQWEPERMGSGEGPRTIRTLLGLYASPAPFSFQWIGDGKRGDEQRDKVTTAVTEIRDQLNPPSDKIYLRERAQMFALGRCSRIMLAGDQYWWDFPERTPGQSEVEYAKAIADWQRAGPVPILWRDLPAETTFPASLSRVEDEVISKVPSTWAELRSIFSEKELAPAIPPDRALWNRGVTLVVYANRTWVCWAVAYNAGYQDVQIAASFVNSSVELKIIRTIEHKMNMCPIRINAGATGFWKEPGIYWSSVLYDVRRLIPQIDRRLSEAATAQKGHAIPGLKVWLNDPDNEGAAKIKRLLAGDMVPLDLGQGGEAKEDIEAIYIPPTNPHMLELAQFGLQLCRGLTGASESLQGGFGPAQMPAWTRNNAVKVALNYLAPWTEAVVEADKDVIETILRCAEVFGEPITLVPHSEMGSAITLEPGDLSHWRPLVLTEYEPKAPRDENAQLEIAVDTMIKIKTNHLPLSVSWVGEEYLGIEKMSEMRSRAWLDEFLNSDEMRTWYMQQLLQEADVELNEPESMPLVQFQQKYGGRIPPQMMQMAVQKAGGVPPTNGVSPATRGTIQQPSPPPYSRTPMPVETVPGSGQ